MNEFWWAGEMTIYLQDIRKKNRDIQKKESRSGMDQFAGTLRVFDGRKWTIAFISKQKMNVIRQVEWGVGVRYGVFGWR